MKYVIDATVGFMWEVTEPFSAKARRLRDDFRNGYHELLAPDLFPTEIANAHIVSERRGRILPGQAVLFFTDLFTTLPAIHFSLPDLSPRAIVIAATTVASVHDSLYVAMAEQQGCELLTGADKLLRNLHTQFPFIKHIKTLP